MKTPVRSTKDVDGDVVMGGVDEFGAKAGKGPSDDKDKTITQKNVLRSSRLGKRVKRPAAGAPHDKVIEYYQYLMSGQGMYLRIGFLSLVVLRSYIIRSGPHPGGRRLAGGAGSRSEVGIQ